MRPRSTSGVKGGQQTKDLLPGTERQYHPLSHCIQHTCTWSWRSILFDGLIVTSSRYRDLKIWDSSSDSSCQLHLLSSCKRAVDHEVCWHGDILLLLWWRDWHLDWGYSMWCKHYMAWLILCLRTSRVCTVMCNNVRLSEAFWVVSLPQGGVLYPVRL